MRPLTILQVGAFPFPLHQGSQVYAAGQCAGLLARGHRVILACWAHGRGAPPEGLAIERARRVPGGAVERSGPHWSRPLQDLALLGAVRRVLAREPVDVIHAHNVEAPVVATLARGRRPIPVVYDQHTVMGEELPTYFERRPTRRLAAVAGRGVDRGVAAACDAAVALSERGAADLRARGVDPVILLPPAVRLDDLRGADPARARRRWDLGDRSWVVYAGNTDAYQDLPDGLAAVARVPEAGLLLLTGDDPAPWIERAGALGIGPERRRIVRTTAFAEVRDGIAAAAVAISPRTQCAGFPIKLLNTLGLGVPTVAARGSARDLPGVVAVPDHDPEAMARAIQALLADPARRDALGRAAREAVVMGWSWQTRAGELEDFYRALLRQVPHPGCCT